jgi:hypothetical protein
MPGPGRRAARLAAGTLVVAALIFSLGAGGSGGATGPALIRLTDLQTKAETVRSPVDVGSVEFIQQSLFGSGSKSRPIGHSIVTCMAVSKRERSCEGSYLLPRGMVLTRCILQSRLFYTAAITGGTGYYNNARGTLTVTETRLNPRREILIFRLTG